MWLANACGAITISCIQRAIDILPLVCRRFDFSHWQIAQKQVLKFVKNSILRKRKKEAIVLTGYKEPVARESNNRRGSRLIFTERRKRLRPQCARHYPMHRKRLRQAKSRARNPGSKTTPDDPATSATIHDIGTSQKEEKCQRGNSKDE